MLGICDAGLAVTRKPCVPTPANFTPSQRLHQPHRPLQPPEHLHRTRGRRPWIPNLPVPDQRILAGVDPQPASVGLEHKEVRCVLHEHMTIGPEECEC